jgi:hypothetical protein
MVPTSPDIKEPLAMVREIFFPGEIGFRLKVLFPKIIERKGVT